MAMSEFRVVVIGASAGGLDPVRLITEALPRNCGAAVIVVMQVGSRQGELPAILNWHGKVPAILGREGDSIEPGRLYVAPPDRHMLLVTPGLIHFDAGPRVHNTRPAAEATEPGMPAAAFALDNPEVLSIKQLSRRVFQFCSEMTVA